ncbi:toprim domain-containing protein [Peptococcaceae bacterium]|nr:toprim domain-containing protein [Peptococcaceae bacterium]
MEHIENTTKTRSTVKGNTHYINPCPICQKKDHFAINTQDNLYHSFSGCCQGGSIVDFLIEYEKMDLATALKKTAELAGMDSEYAINKRDKVAIVNTKSQKEVTTTKNAVNCTVNFNELIEKLHSQVQETNYYTQRGLTAKTINKYKLGYSSEGLNLAIKETNLLQEKESLKMAAYKYILPIWDCNDYCSYFITRLDDHSVNEKTGKLHKIHNLKGYQTRIFNDRYLQCNKQEPQHIFITEGIFDALSIEELDYQAIALNSTANINKFLNILKDNYKKNKNNIFILAADNDTAGQEMQEKLIKNFKTLKLDLEIYQMPAEHKDFNDFLVKNRKQAEKSIADFMNKLKNEDFLVNIPDNIFNIANKKTKVISTGFQNLDMLLCGGLRPGLITVGGISSIGKTSFIAQITDNIARAGNDVVFFSLEMSKKELFARSLVKEVALMKIKNDGSITDSTDDINIFQILDGECDPDIFQKIIFSYQPVAKNLAVIEGGQNTGVKKIRQEIEQKIRVRKKKPVVVIDYLQIIPTDRFDIGGKQSVDANMTEIKKISRDLDVSIILISSVNRTAYHTEINFESFKESGIIEYSSDIVLGIQFQQIEEVTRKNNLSDKYNLINQLKESNPREIEIVILKQRNGQSYGRQSYNFYSEMQYWEEVQ